MHTALQDQWELNSSPIDELGDGACQSGRWFQGEQQALSHKPWAGHTGIHGNSASGNHPPGTVTLTRSVEILNNPILTKSTNEGGEGREKKQNNWMICCLKQTVPHMAGTYNMYDSRSPVTSRRMIPWPPLTNTGLILTCPNLYLATFKNQS